MRYSLCLLAFGVLSTACAVEGIDNVFGQNTGDEGGGNSTNPGTGASSNDGGNPNPDTTPSVGGNVPSDGGNPNPGPGGGNPPDTTEQGPGPTTTGPTTTGDPPIEPTVFCNGNECSPGQVCCHNQLIGTFDECVQEGSCQGEGNVELSCNGPEDCDNGQECCGDFNNEVGWGRIECRSQCNANQIEHCFGNEDACDQGVCTPSSSLGFGYSYCRVD